MPPLVRFVFRASSLELTSADDFVAAEMHDDAGQPDLALSVFLLDNDGQTVQLTAEQKADTGADPPRAGNFLRMDALSSVPPVPDLERGRFAFRNARHHELRLASEADLRAIAAAVLAAGASLAIVAAKPQIRTYVRARVAAKDPEWEGFMAADATSEEWRKFGEWKAPP